MGHKNFPLKLVLNNEGEQKKKDTETNSYTTRTQQRPQCNAATWYFEY